jgi:hypothetical protein
MENIVKLNTYLSVNKRLINICSHNSINKNKKYKSNVTKFVLDVYISESLYMIKKIIDII